MASASYLAACPCRSGPAFVPPVVAALLRRRPPRGCCSTVKFGVADRRSCGCSHRKILRSCAVSARDWRTALQHRCGASGRRSDDPLHPVENPSACHARLRRLCWMPRCSFRQNCQCRPTCMCWGKKSALRAEIRSPAGGMALAELVQTARRRLKSADCIAAL